MSDYLARLNPEQREAVETLDGPLLGIKPGKVGRTGPARPGARGNAARRGGRRFEPIAGLSQRVGQGAKRP